jgi:Ca2+-binding EF-hand superfamily protein
MKKVLMSLLIVFACTTISFAAESDFKKTDKNNDGRISKKEYTDAVDHTFNNLDKNKDGYLTRNELHAADKTAVEKFMKEADINKDGKISKEEFAAAAGKRFKFLDKNNDGFIDQKEWNDIKEGINPKNSKTAPVSPLLIFTF